MAGPWAKYRIEIQKHKDSGAPFKVSGDFSDGDLEEFIAAGKAGFWEEEWNRRTGEIDPDPKCVYKIHIKNRDYDEIFYARLKAVSDDSIFVLWFTGVI